MTAAEREARSRQARRLRDMMAESFEDAGFEFHGRGRGYIPSGRGCLFGSLHDAVPDVVVRTYPPKRMGRTELAKIVKAAKSNGGAALVRFTMDGSWLVCGLESMEPGWGISVNTVFGVFYDGDGTPWRRFLQSYEEVSPTIDRGHT